MITSSCLDCLADLHHRCDGKIWDEAMESYCPCPCAQARHLRSRKERDQELPESLLRMLGR